MPPTYQTEAAKILRVRVDAVIVDQIIPAEIDFKREQQHAVD
ncbi:MAG: hypothetical protein ACUZ9M_07750 [Candidatus Scalindua sp.]